MTLARKFLMAWHRQAKTISARDLARRVDPEVRIVSSGHPIVFDFLFTDHSVAHAEGRGRNFKLWSDE